VGGCLDQIQAVGHSRPRDPSSLCPPYVDYKAPPLLVLTPSYIEVKSASACLLVANSLCVASPAFSGRNHIFRTACYETRLPWIHHCSLCRLPGLFNFIVLTQTPPRLQFQNKDHYYRLVRHYLWDRNGPKLMYVRAALPGAAPVTNIIRPQDKLFSIQKVAQNGSASRFMSSILSAALRCWNADRDRCMPSNA
jgi:hypothetical protein